MNKELIINNDPKSPVSEAFRALRTNMQYLKHDSKQQTIVTTSTVQGEGKTWITVNLAIAFAQLGKKTLLIDSDMRVPRVHKIFEMDQYPGLSNYLSKISQTGRNEEYTLNNILKYSDIKNLALVLAGSIPPNPSELLSSNRLQELIDEAKEKFDVIIFDGTPCLLVTDAIIISRIVDSTIIVTSKRKTKLDDLKEVKKRVENAGGHIVGVILNRVKESSKKYESKYYYSSDKKSRKRHSRYSSGRHSKSDIFDENEEIKRELQNEFHSELEEDRNIINIMDGNNTNHFGDIIQDENLINLDEFDNHEEETPVQIHEEPKIAEFVSEKIEVEEKVEEEPVIKETIIEETVIDEPVIETIKEKEEIPKKETVKKETVKKETVKKETVKKETKKKTETKKVKEEKDLKTKKVKEEKVLKPKKVKEEKVSETKKEPKKEKEVKPKKEAAKVTKEKKTATKTKTEKETKKIEPIVKKTEKKTVKEKVSKAEAKKKDAAIVLKKKEEVVKPIKKKEVIKTKEKEPIVNTPKKEEPVKTTKKTAVVKKKITAKEVIKKELKNKEPIKKEPKKKVVVKETKKETKEPIEKKTAAKTITKKPVKRAAPKRFKEPEETVTPRKTLGKKILDLFTEEVDEEEAKRR